MAQLTDHLVQINLCAQSISELSFPGKRGFTNALLANHDITSLIRDTEAHERALFHLAPPTLPTDIANDSLGAAPISSAALKARRATVNPARQPRSRAVAAVLGGDLYAKIQPSYGRHAGEIDVDILLQGAEKLATVYPIAGALEKINQLKRRHHQLQANIAHFEDKIVHQTAELQQMSSTTKLEHDAQGETETTILEPIVDAGAGLNWENIQDEIKELEHKKKSLEERVTGMEKDLGGLLR